MTNLLIWLINFVVQALIILIIVSVILSYVMDCYHPIRRWVDSIVEPLLMPIRRVLPPLAGLDFSPLVLILLLQLIANLIVRLLR
ncbi:MAG TPA: YggT family protein [Anaerolineales bacterium]|nr:YggT family protein [Anaerolineales bacterium]